MQPRGRLGLQRLTLWAACQNPLGSFDRNTGALAASCPDEGLRDGMRALECLELSNVQVMLGSTDFRGRNNRTPGSQLVPSLPERVPFKPPALTSGAKAPTPCNSLQASPALGCPLPYVCLLFNPQTLGPCPSAMSRAWLCGKGKWREGKEGEGRERDKMRKKKEVE